MLQLENVSYSHNNKLILDNISFVISDSDFLVITGPNGSGKSTLAKLIMGIIKPTSGRILFNKQDITKLSVTDRAKLGISYAFQQPICIKGVTVKDMIGIALGESASDNSINKFLNIVGLDPSNYLNRELDNSLSGGELKRIEIASVLARNSILIVFDEPEAGIDLWSFDNLNRVFKKLLKSGKTTVVISHQERIINAASKILLLEDMKPYLKYIKDNYGKDYLKSFKKENGNEK